MDRKGRVTDVSVGDHQTVTLAEVEGKRSANHLSGIRCLHTHPNGNGRLSAVDINSLKILKLDAMTAIGITKGHAQVLYTGILSPQAPDEVTIFGPDRPSRTEFGYLNNLILETDRLLRRMLPENDTLKEGLS